MQYWVTWFYLLMIWSGPSHSQSSHAEGGLYHSTSHGVLNSFTRPTNDGRGVPDHAGMRFWLDAFYFIDYPWSCLIQVAWKIKVKNCFFFLGMNIILYSLAVHLLKMHVKLISFSLLGGMWLNAKWRSIVFEVSFASVIMEANGGTGY